MDIKDFSEQLGREISKYRTENNLTQKQFAEKAGINYYLSCKLEMGRIEKTSVKTISMVLKVLKMNLTLDIE